MDSDGTRLKGKDSPSGPGPCRRDGVLDQRRVEADEEVSAEEACELGRRAIYHATFRDAFSGGTISVYHVSEKGWTKMSGTDVGELHFEYYPRRARRGGGENRPGRPWRREAKGRKDERTRRRDARKPEVRRPIFAVRREATRDDFDDGSSGDAHA